MGLIAESHSTLSVINTTTIGDLARFTVTGGLLVAGDVLAFEALGVVGTSALPASSVLSLVIGTTTAASFTVTHGPDSWRFTATVAIESTTAQRAVIHYSAGDFAAAGTVYGTSAENTASNTDVALRLDMATSGPDEGLHCHAAALAHGRVT